MPQCRTQYTLTTFSCAILMTCMKEMHVSKFRDEVQNGRRVINQKLNLKDPLRWRHNWRDSVSNHQPHHCLLNRYSDADQRKHQSSASLAFVWGIDRGPVNSPHKWPVTRKMFPFDDVIMPSPVFSLSFPLGPWTDLSQLYKIKVPGEGVTKPISSPPLFSEFFSIIKTHLSYWIPRLYLTGVAAAQLRWHLSNIKVIRII